MRSGGSGAPEGWAAWDDDEAAEQEEEVERRLAQYVFVREERDREVRMLFRDVPAPHVAAAFMAAGATLISITGEWVSPQGQTPTPSESTDVAVPAQGGRRRRKSTPPASRNGEPVVLYFFALRDTVYTVSIALPTGVGESIAGIYPGARLAESEVEHRLGMVFRQAA